MEAITILDCKKTEVVEEVKAEAETPEPVPTEPFCRRCGAKRKDDILSDHDDPHYCSGKCRKEHTGSAVPDTHPDFDPAAIKKTGDCLNCGAKKKPNVVWYSDDYCSGKCASQAGIEIMPAPITPGSMTVEHKVVTEARTRIRNLKEQVVIKRKELTALDKKLDALASDRNELIREGGDTNLLNSTMDNLYKKRKWLEDEIESIENVAILKEHRKIAQHQSISRTKAEAELEERKKEYVELLQEVIDMAGSLFYEYREICKEAAKNHGARRSAKRENLFMQLVIEDAIRKPLLKRVEWRKAKLAHRPAN